jgi:hypothetical protein
MKSNILILVIGILFPLFSGAQTLDEIISKHIAAHGGAKNIESIKSIKTTGQFTAFSETKDFFSIKTKAGAYYSELWLGKNFVKEAFNGKSGWTIDPWQDISYARRLNAAEENVFLQQVVLVTPFFNYKQQGLKVEYAGKQTIEGIEAFVLKLTKKNGKTETWYLRTSNYLEFRCESEWVDFAEPSPVQIFYDDFRTVNGVVLPFNIERIYGQRDCILQIDKIEFNPTFDLKILEMPRKNQMNQLAFMQGKWTMKIEGMSRRGTWYPIDSTSSSIDFASQNLLQENVNYENYFPISKRVEYTFNETSKKYRISVFDDFSSSFDAYEGNFTDSSFVFDDVQISFNISNTEGIINTQFSITKNGNDGFTITRKSSSDAGKTWKSVERYTYTKPKEKTGL